MTVRDVLGLRNQGRKAEAYEAARTIYATDKSQFAATAMFWTAVDMLKVKVNEGKTDEAFKIYLALERLLNNVRDKKEWMYKALAECKTVFEGTDYISYNTKNLANHIQTGIWGEELAAAFLREKGYVILERDWHSKHRDIDIVAQQGNCIVFVEVKTRRNRVFAEPIQAVNHEKQKNLSRAINHYIRYRKLENPWRFDVITIVGPMGSTMPEIEHIEDFQLRPWP